MNTGKAGCPVRPAPAASAMTETLVAGLPAVPQSGPCHGATDRGTEDHLRMFANEEATEIRLQKAILKRDLRVRDSRVNCYRPVMATGLIAAFPSTSANRPGFRKP